MKTITAEQLKPKRERGEQLTLINTLSAKDFASTKIPDSINVPFEGDNFPARVEQQVGGKDQPVVVYCASAECQSSTKAAQALEDAGFTDVTDFEGGAKEWQNSGEKLVASGA